LKGRLVSIAIAGALLAVTAVTPALAGSHNAKRYPTTITIQADQPGGLLKGRVKSDKKQCFQNREVRIIINGEDFGDDTTTSGGHYRFDFGAPISPGNYEVQAPKLRVGNKVVCQRGSSKIINLG
jgi:hypothetical protein